MHSTTPTRTWSSASGSTILPVEFVVRGYLAGTTGTSILTHYRARAARDVWHRASRRLRDNENLPRPIITPTSKARDGGHDEPLSRAEIIERGLMTAAAMGRVAAMRWRCSPAGRR